VGEAIVKVVVDCEEPLDGLVEHLRALMPDATIVEIVENAASRRLEPAHHGDLGDRERTLDELFDDYLAENGSSTVPATTVRTLWHAVQESTHDGEGVVHVDSLDDLLTCDVPTPHEVAV